MYLPCENAPGAKLLHRESIRDMHRRREEKQAVYDRATKLQRDYPHLRDLKVKYLMWAVARFGLTLIEETAAAKLSAYTFREHLNHLNH
jgi:hypothetical protein